MSTATAEAPAQPWHDLSGDNLMSPHDWDRSYLAEMRMSQSDEWKLDLEEPQFLQEYTLARRAYARRGRLPEGVLVQLVMNQLQRRLNALNQGKKKTSE